MARVIRLPLSIAVDGERRAWRRPGLSRGGLPISCAEKPRFRSLGPGQFHKIFFTGEREDCFWEMLWCADVLSLACLSLADFLAALCLEMATASLGTISDGADEINFGTSLPRRVFYDDGGRHLSGELK